MYKIKSQKNLTVNFDKLEPDHNFVESFATDTSKIGVDDFVTTTWDNLQEMVYLFFDCW